MIEIIDQNQYQIDWQTIRVQPVNREFLTMHMRAGVAALHRDWCLRTMKISIPESKSTVDQSSNQSSIINHIRVEYHQNSCRWHRAPQVWIVNTAIVSKNISDASDSIVRFILCLYWLSHFWYQKCRCPFVVGHFVLQTFDIKISDFNKKNVHSHHNIFNRKQQE